MAGSFVKKIWVFLGVICLFNFFLLTPVAGVLDFKKGVTIRDSEIETMLRSYLDPIFKVAGLTPGSEEFIIIIDPEVNAFASSGELLIINTGFLTTAKSAWEVIGVLAHETGHIAGNHIVRGSESQKKILVPALLTGLLGTAAGALAGGPEGGLAGALGTMEMAHRSLLHYNRGQEASADQAALKYLDKLHWSSKGLLEAFEQFSNQELLLTKNQDPYVRTHPLTQERLQTIRRHLETSPYKDAPLPPHFEEMFNRVQIKLKAFTLPPVSTLNKYPLTDQSLAAYYSRAIAYLRMSQTEQALQEINVLIQKFPEDPFFLEMKGQILFMSGRIKEAIPPYEKAVSLRPEDNSLKLSYAQALLEDGTLPSLQKALKILEEILTHDADEAFAWRLQAIAQGRQDKIGDAALSLSEFYLRTGDKKQARAQASRALKSLKQRTPAALRALDIKNSLELNES